MAIFRHAVIFFRYIVSTDFSILRRSVWTSSKLREKLIIKKPELDYEFLSDSTSVEEIANRISVGKGQGDIKKVLKLYSDLEELKQRNISPELEKVENLLIQESSILPNRTHPHVLKNATDQPIVKEIVGKKREFGFPPKNFSNLCKNTFHNKYITYFAEEDSYYLIKDLAELEHALIKFSLERLISKGFILMSVPDILHPSLFECCGLVTSTSHDQLYKFDKRYWNDDACLSGTAEIALVSFFMNKCLPFKDLPQLVTAVSRCFRKEAFVTSELKKLFRVHLFNKVEMFGVTANETGEESALLLEKFVDIQKSLFSELGLHFKILDMPVSELGAPAYRKYDIEAWMPGRDEYGEISSTSNCTDYQSRRLHIKYQLPSDVEGHSSKVKHVHTVNGTACAIPRMLISIYENYQDKDGRITIPKVLQKYMGNRKIIKPGKRTGLTFLRYINDGYSGKNNEISEIEEETGE